MNISSRVIAFISVCFFVTFVVTPCFAESYKHLNGRVNVDGVTTFLDQEKSDKPDLRISNVLFDSQSNNFRLSLVRDGRNGYLFWDMELEDVFDKKVFAEEEWGSSGLKMYAFNDAEKSPKKLTGYNLISLCPYRRNGKLLCAAVFQQRLASEHKNGVIYGKKTFVENQIEKLMKDENPRHPSEINWCLTDKGELWFTVNTVRKSDDCVVEWDLTKTTLKSKQTTYEADNYRIDHICAYPSSKSTKYVATFVQDKVGSEHTTLAIELKPTDENKNVNDATGGWNTRVLRSYNAYFENPEQIAKDIGSEVDKFVENEKVSQATVYVSYCGKELLSKQYGSKKSSIKESTPFRIASITKRYTEQAIYKLIREGKDDKLTLETEAFKYLGYKNSDLKGDPRLKDITIQHLLDHKAGWDRQATEEEMDLMFDISQEKLNDFSTPSGFNGPEPQTDGDKRHWAIINHTVANEKLQFDPGVGKEYKAEDGTTKKVAAYSNFGYCVLGRVIEHATKKSYIDYICEDVLKDCDAHGSVAIGSDGPSNNEAAYEAFNTENGNESPADWSYTPVYSPASMDAHGGLISSAKDVARFFEVYGCGKHNGALPGTWATAQTINNLTFVVLLNRRMASSNDDQKKKFEEFFPALEKIVNAEVRYTYTRVEPFKLAVLGKKVELYTRLKGSEWVLTDVDGTLKLKEKVAEKPEEKDAEKLEEKERQNWTLVNRNALGTFGLKHGKTKAGDVLDGAKLSFVKDNKNDSQNFQLLPLSGGGYYLTTTTHKEQKERLAVLNEANEFKAVWLEESEDPGWHGAVWHIRVID